MKILVCMDSSTYAGEIVNEVSKRSWPEGTEFYLVTVLELKGTADSGMQMRHEAAIVLSDRVEFLAKRIKGASVKGEVLEGPVVAAINQAASDWGANLLMIGSHGDTGIRKTGIGSIAAAIVNDSPCSVEVLKIQLHRPQAAGIGNLHRSSTK